MTFLAARASSDLFEVMLTKEVTFVWTVEFLEMLEVALAVMFFWALVVTLAFLVELTDTFLASTGTMSPLESTVALLTLVICLLALVASFY